MRDRGWRFDAPVVPRGYIWWYLDALSDDGVHGITLIAFIGSVFSPYYRWARRGGRPADPTHHVCMNVALYGGAGKRWAMTERGAAALRRDATHLQIGPSSLHWDGTTLTADIAEMTAPIPGRIRGRIRVHPQGLGTREIFLDGIGHHRWAPIAPGARVEVQMQKPELSWQGTAYLDTNAGDTPLEEAFIGWNWSRSPTTQGTAILYHGQRRAGDRFCVALRYAPDGTAEAFRPPPEVVLPRTFWRMPRITRAESSDAMPVQVLEDAPFYARTVLKSHLLGEQVTAVHESLSLDRFVKPWVQFMLPFKAPRVLT